MGRQFDSYWERYQHRSQERMSQRERAKLYLSFGYSAQRVHEITEIGLVTAQELKKDWGKYALDIGGEQSDTLLDRAAVHRTVHHG